MKRNLYNLVGLGPDSGTPGASVGFIIHSAANFLARLGDDNASQHARELRLLAEALVKYREDLQDRYTIEGGK